MPRTLDRRSRSLRRARGARGGEAGFVISELVLVVSLVTALLIVVVVSVNGIHKDTRRGECQTELRRLKVATERFFVETKRYPTSTAELAAKRMVALRDVAHWSVEGVDIDERPVYKPSGSCA